MPGKRAPKIELTEEEREELKKLIKAHKTSQQKVFRARIILKLAEDKTEAEIGREMATSRQTVRLWRNHWMERKLLPVIERLKDEERPGAPARITAEQWCQIVALACEPPEQYLRPISHWTPRELADEAIKQKIIESISVRHVGRFLKSCRYKAASNALLA
jgi:putative transposase